MKTDKKQIIWDRNELEEKELTDKIGLYPEEENLTLSENQ